MWREVDMFKFIDTLYRKEVSVIDDYRNSICYWNFPSGIKIISIDDPNNDSRFSMFIYMYR
jgi:hypothetical protein